MMEKQLSKNYCINKNYCKNRNSVELKFYAIFFCKNKNIFTYKRNDKNKKPSYAIVRETKQSFTVKHLNNKGLLRASQ